MSALANPQSVARVHRLQHLPRKFTAFSANEWISPPNNSNRQRNIHYKDDKYLSKMPFSAFDSQPLGDLLDAAGCCEGEIIR